MSTWRIKDNGEYELHGEKSSLLQCFPALDGHSLRPLAVEVTRNEAGGKIRYSLADKREVVIYLGKDTNGDCDLVADLLGFEQAPHWFYPFYGARLEGIERFFRQGIGFSGPSNFIKIDEITGLYSFDSYLCTGIVARDDTTLAIGALQHADYLQQTTLRNRVRSFNFRNREVAANNALLDLGFSMEGIPINSKGLTLPKVRVIERSTAWDAMRSLAMEIGRSHGVSIKPPSYHWCSWYNRASHFTFAELQIFLKGAQELQEPLATVQLDDGYQEAMGDWLIPSARWPGGLAAAFAEIKNYGYTPGIWIGPYMVERESILFKDHPDWVLHDLAGNPVVTWKRYDGSSKSAEYYILDTSHPDAMAYICGVFKVFYDFGARFFKTDFLEWGYKDSLTVRRHTPGKTAHQYQREFFEKVREIIGSESYWLGCISLFSPGIGLMDSMRVSSDTGPEWGNSRAGIDGSEGGVANVIEETYNTLYLNNCLWQNDPDALILRNYFTHLKEHEVRALALFLGQLGVSINTSDNFHELLPERLKLWRFIRPDSTPWTAVLPNWGREKTLLMALRECIPQQRWILAVLNPSKQSVLENIDLASITGLPSVQAALFTPESSHPIGTLTHYCTELEGHSVVLLELSTS